MTPNTDLSNSPLKAILDQATSVPLDQLAVSETNSVASPEEIKGFVTKVAESFGVSDSSAFAGICLLFLKGAANKGAPPTMGVDIKTEEGQATQLTKYDLMVACQAVCKNRFIRRLAKGMAKEIGYFAEKRNLNGDLAIKLNNELVAQGEPPLTGKEKAWASSFSQIIPNLEEFVGGPRVPTLLAQDYSKRFSGNSKPQANSKKQGTITPKGPSSSPAPVAPQAQSKAPRARQKKS